MAVAPGWEHRIPAVRGHGPAPVCRWVSVFIVASVGSIDASQTVLWLLGLVASFATGRFIHSVVLVAVVEVLVRVIPGRRLT